MNDSSAPSGDDSCETCGYPLDGNGQGHANDLHREIEQINGTKNAGAPGHWHTPGGEVPCCEIDALERDNSKLREEVARKRMLLAELHPHDKCDATWCAYCQEGGRYGP